MAPIWKLPLTTAYTWLPVTSVVRLPLTPMVVPSLSVPEYSPAPSRVRKGT